jgi:hypothetical protein
MTLVLTQAAALTAGPFGTLNYTVGGVGGYQLAARAGAMGALTVGYGSAPAAYALTTGLNVAGIAAVASAVNTYLGGLSSAKKAQLPEPTNGCPTVVISSGEISVPVHPADLASFTTTLAAVLNNASNYGAVGT